MSRSRAVTSALLAVVALCAATTHARAQALGDDEPLRRLDANALAGGTYGEAEPGGLAGGDYGATRPDQQPEPPTSATLRIGNPLGAPPRGLRDPAPRRIPVSDDDAYAASGVQAGAFTLRPTLETAGGYDDNPNRDPEGGKGSGFYRLRGGLDARSNWSRHELGARLNGQIRRYVDQTELGYEPEVSAAVTGRLDVTERTQINAELRASLTSSRPGDPETPTGIKGDEITRSAGATLGATHRFNRLSVTLEGAVDRYVTADSKLRSGGTLDNSDRNYNSYEARLRGAYDLSPRLQPFVEVAVDTRDYDEKFDNTDPTRRLGSDGYALRTGASLELTRLVTGEVAVGYGRQTPKDRDLKPVDGLLVDGALAWTPTALTTVRLDARSALRETTLNGAGGVLERQVGLEVEHRLRRNLIATARADLVRGDYKGLGRVDDNWTLSLEGEYRLNRNLAAIGSVRREWQDSSEPGEDYRATIVELGLRFRR
jgi:hypothetical protein